MNKYTLISFLQEAQASRSEWLDFGQILVDGVNLERAAEPVKCIETDFMALFGGNHEQLKTLEWYSEVKVIHHQLHQSYKDLYVETMRMYNPKTVNELIEYYSHLEFEANTLRNKLDEVEQEIQAMSGAEYEALGLDDEPADIEYTEDSAEPEAKPTDTVDVEKIEKETEEEQGTAVNHEDSDDSSLMQAVDISQHHTDRDKNATASENDKNTTVTTIDMDQDSSADDKKSAETAEIHTVISTEKNTVSQTANADNVKQHISLKEMDIKQLQQEKELSELELTHLEQREQLTEKNVEQLKQYYKLKEEEIEAEQHENQRLLEFKIDAWKKTKDEISEIDSEKSGISKEIRTLENEHQEHEKNLKLDKKTEQIARQFEELKKNKTSDLENLQGELASKKDALQKLQEQVRDIEADLDQKEQDLHDLEEKERLKNEERSKEQAKQLELAQQCLNSINAKQEILDTLVEEKKNKKSALEVIDFQIDDLNKSNKVIDQNNTAELKDIECQQQEKQEKFKKNVHLKETKQKEIEAIDKQIKIAESSLDDYKTVLKKVKKEQKDHSKEKLEA